MHHSKTVQGSLNYCKFLVTVLITDTTSEIAHCKRLVSRYEPHAVTLTVH